MNKSLTRSLIGLLTIFIITGIILLSPIGLKSALKFSSSLLSGEIRYSSVTGTLFSDVKLKDFQYRDKSTSLRIQNLKLSWNPLKLLSRKIMLYQFKADRIYLTYSAKSENKKYKQTSKSKKTDKLYLVNIKKAKINKLFIGTKPNQYPLFIPHIDLNAVFFPKHIKIQSYIRVNKPVPIGAYFSINGNQNRYKLDARIFGAHIDWQLYGLGSIKNISLNLNEVRTLGGTFSFKFNAAWKPKIKWGFDLKGTQLKANKIFPKLPTDISVKAQSTGGLNAGQLKFTLNSYLTTPGTKIYIHTARENRMNIKWEVKINELSNLWKPFRGRLQTNGHWSPGKAIANTVGNLTASHLSVLDYKANHINAKWSVLPNTKKKSTLTIKGTEIKVRNLLIQKLNLQGYGKQKIHYLKSSIKENNTQGIPAFKKSRYHLKTWNFTLKRLHLLSNLYRNWELIKPTKINLFGTKIETNNLCFLESRTHSRFCLQGSWNINAPWNFTAIGKNFNPVFFTKIFLPKLEVKSKANLSAKVLGNAKQWNKISVNIKLEKGKLNYQINRNSINSPLRSGSIFAQIRPHILNAKAILNLSKFNKIQITASKMNSCFSGKIKACLKDLSRFERVFSTINKLTGNLSITLNLLINSEKPIVSGDILFHNGSFNLPKIGINLKKTNLQIHATGNNSHYELTTYSQSKPIKASGQLNWSKSKLFSLSNIKAENVLMMNTKQYIIYASPQLTLKTTGHYFDLIGSVYIPKAIIQPYDFKNTVTLPLQEIVYIEPKLTSGDSIWKTTGKVKVSLGDNVTLHTYGVNARINGEATVISNPGETTVGNGYIKISKGTYNAYNTELTITPGSFLEFANSPIDNPNLDIRATKKIQTTRGTSSQNFGIGTTTVGINATGTSKNLKFELFSIPGNLSKADILSYLLLGYSSENVRGDKLSLLKRTARKVGRTRIHNEISALLSQFKQTLGLAEFGVESEKLLDAFGTPIDEQSSFVIAKQLTKNIYVRYSLGLGQGPFVPVNIFQLRYTFGKKWMLQMDSSTYRNGADMLYTIEKD